MNRANLLIAFFVLAIGCDSSEREQFERWNADYGPALKQLQSAADAVLLDMAVDDDQLKGLVDACGSGNSALVQLRNADIQETDRVRNTIAHQADVLLQDHDLYCKGNVPNIRRCARWCEVSWTQLAIAVERVHVRAAAVGVAFPSLANPFRKDR